MGAADVIEAITNSGIKYIDNFRKLNFDVTILNANVFLRFLKLFDKTPKLDFVDCLLRGYKMKRNIDIVTFDKKLKKRLDEFGYNKFER